MAKNAAARLVEHEIAQCAVAGDEARLLPHRIARWRLDAADDHITHFALGMTADDLDGLAAPHLTARENPLVWREACAI